MESKKMTMEQWKKVSKGCKSIINGERFVLAWTGKGTGLVPVEIIKNI